ncbi:MAG: tRNA pseudouridine(55) synthase TruB [Methylococcaceae bacterium]|nr:tRNA pseudouridine(55) synthase TruB [Methylococcaceae bacterium]
MSKRTSGRNINGIVLLDKRLGVSSNRALQEVRRLFNANKAGHTGSLDPLATGLLPLCFGEATKIAGLMLDEQKRYQVVVQLGVVTDTGDAEGAIIATRPVPVFSEQDIDSCLQHFVGDIDQVPPMYSALKHNGKKLYELARKGEVIDRKARRIRIIELHRMAVSQDCLTLNVLCSKGTYIRSLAEDIGSYLGCGATVSELRRLEVGKFSIESARTIEQLSDMGEQKLLACLIDVDKPLDYLPAVLLSSEQAERVLHGQAINMQESCTGSVRLYHDKAFLGLGEILMDGKLAPKKMFNLNIESHHVDCDLLSQFK